MLAGLAAVAHLGALLTLPLALSAGTLSPPDASPWLLSVTTIATSAGAIAWRPLLVWANVVGTSVLIGVDRVLASSSGLEAIAAQDALITLLFNSIFAALGLALRRAGVELDRTAAIAAGQIQVEAAIRGRERERDRVSALVHDRVLVALIAAASPGVGVRNASASATDALTALDGADTPEPGDLPGVACLWELQAITTEVAPEAQFDFDPVSGPPVPREAARAVFDATAAALRNSLQHGSRPDGSTNRAVHVTIDDHVVRVTVIDDGPGFSAARVSPTRLGIRISIVGRIRAVGGDARIVSVPGTGTRVQLEWARA